MTPRRIRLTVLVAALGYFVDIYDLVLFAILRVSSVADLGVPEADRFATGVLLINMQMGGMLVGGILWGVLGDKRGRVAVLFGSIVLYSAANVGNAFVHTVEAYAVMRLLAGIGLAGELGAGVTLVAEVMPRESRGWGTTIVATVGILGAVVAALVGGETHWRTAYVIGGVLGFLLLFLRVGLFESGMFAKAKESMARRGAFLSLFSSRERLKRYACVVLIGTPIWFVVAVLVAFAPEMGPALGLPVAPSAGTAIMACYVGLAIGDLASGALSQLLRRRRSVVAFFLALLVATMAGYFALGGSALPVFHASCVALGIAAGYWAVFVTMAAEQFGTNLRATVATTAPNFVRGAVVPVTAAVKALAAPLGLVGAAALVGAVLVVIAAVALRSLEETFGKDLDYVEVV